MAHCLSNFKSLFNVTFSVSSRPSSLFTFDLVHILKLNKPSLLHLFFNDLYVACSISDMSYSLLLTMHCMLLITCICFSSVEYNLYKGRILGDQIIRTSSGTWRSGLGPLVLHMRCWRGSIIKHIIQSHIAPRLRPRYPNLESRKLHLQTPISFPCGSYVILWLWATSQTLLSFPFPQINK